MDRQLGELSKDFDPEKVDVTVQSPQSSQYSTHKQCLGRCYRNDSAPESPVPTDQDLPPADGGQKAWRFLFAAFMIEAFQWGQQIHQA